MREKSMTTDVSLKTYQSDHPAWFSRIAGVEWAWRDTDAESNRIPVVFLPGAGGTGDVFFRAVNALRDSRRTITVRYPALSDVDSIVSGLVSLLIERGLQHVDIAATSLGGYIAQSIAIERPALVRRILLGNTFYDGSWLQAKMSRDAVLATTPDAFLRRAIAQFDALPQASEEQVDFRSTMLALAGSEQSGEMARDSFAAVLGTRPLGPLDLNAGDIAILDTEDDPVVDAATRSAMRDRYRKSARYTFATGGHYPFLLNPSQYNETIRIHLGDE